MQASRPLLNSPSLSLYMLYQNATVGVRNLKRKDVARHQTPAKPPPTLLQSRLYIGTSAQVVATYLLPIEPPRGPLQHWPRPLSPLPARRRSKLLPHRISGKVRGLVSTFLVSRHPGVVARTCVGFRSPGLGSQACVCVCLYIYIHKHIDVYMCKHSWIQTYPA